jgi:hypothetical protein
MVQDVGTGDLPLMKALHSKEASSIVILITISIDKWQNADITVEAVLCKQGN